MRRATLTQSAVEVQRRSQQSVLGSDARPAQYDRHQSGVLEQLFSRCFFADYQTRLCGGAAEPLYQPATAGAAAVIYYRHDYFRSALHEVAHWCVAGDERRLREDYGYWYEPDGRNAEQQATFLQLEVLPQALERLFCLAADHPFAVSVDNLQGEAGDVQGFARAVAARAAGLWPQRINPRARCWLEALSWHFRDQDFARVMMSTEGVVLLQTLD